MSRATFRAFCCRQGVHRLRPAPEVQVPVSDSLVYEGVKCRTCSAEVVRLVWDWEPFNRTLREIDIQHAEWLTQLFRDAPFTSVQGDAQERP